MGIEVRDEIQFYLRKKEKSGLAPEAIQDVRLIEDLERKGDEIERLRLQIRILNDREKKIIKGLLKVLDSIEWFSKISLALTNNGLKVTIENTWKKIRKELLQIRLYQINQEGEIFDDSLHNCIDTIEDVGKNDNEISEVIKSGYIYKGEILRPAEVIVVKNLGIVK